MKNSHTRRFLISVGEILLITATSLTVPVWPVQSASATVESPGLLASATAPSETIVNSPWIADSSGAEWTYGTTTSSMGTLISRNRSTGSYTSIPGVAGDDGAIAGLYSPLTNTVVFSVRRPGAGNRITTFDLTAGTRISTRALATDENNVRALAFNTNADSYIIGTNQSPAKIMKFATASGALEYSTTLATGLKEVTAFIRSGTDLLAATNTNPVKLVTISRNRLIVDSVHSLASGTPTLLDPIVIGATAYVGTDATPGRITVIDIPTRTVIRSMVLNSDEVGARNLVVDESTGTLYATTENPQGPRIASFRLSNLARLGTTELGDGPLPTSMLLYGRTLAVGYAGTRGIETFTVAPAPNTPVITGVEASHSSLTVSWGAVESVEPIMEYSVNAASGSTTRSCTTTGTSCVIQGLVNGTSYALSLVARSAAGSSVAAIGSGLPRSVPDAPTLSRVTRGNSSVSLAWNPPGDDGGEDIISYTVRVTQDSTVVSELTTTETSVTVSGLSNGLPYDVAVIAVNVLGPSVSSTSAQVTPATTPESPHGITATRLDEAANVTWLEPPSDGGDPVTSYRVSVHTGDLPAQSFIATESPFRISGLTNGTSYVISVSAANAVGEGSVSDLVEVTPATVPDSPTALAASATDGGAILEWSGATSDGGDPITAYRVRVWNDATVVAEFDTTDTIASVSSLVNGVSYRVTISAVNSVGESASSAPVIVSPVSPPVIGPPVIEPPLPPAPEPPVVEPPVVEPETPEPPTITHAPSPPLDLTILKKTRTRITVGWTDSPDVSTTISDYRVQVSRFKARRYTTAREVTSETPWVTLAKPRHGSLYIRVIAINRVGESAPSRPKRLVKG